jgi:hypothetical protein
LQEKNALAARLAVYTSTLRNLLDTPDAPAPGTPPAKG